MNLLLLAAIIIGVVFFLFALSLKGGKQGSTEYSYQRKPFLSSAERSFYGVLAQAVGDTGLVFSKVRIADVITPKKGMNRSDRQKAFNSISSKHFDYLVCDPKDCSVKLAVELDDSSHQSVKAQKRDALVNSACKSADLPLLRIKATRAYVVDDIRQQVERLMLRPKDDTEVKVLEGKPDDTPSLMEAIPQCPKCSEQMKLRKVKRGDNEGNEFWGCSTFPKCRGVIKI